MGFDSRRQRWFFWIIVLVQPYPWISGHQQRLCLRYGQAASLRFSIPAMVADTLFFFGFLLAGFLLGRCSPESRRPIRDRRAVVGASLALFVAVASFGMAQFATFYAGSQMLRRHGWPFEWWPWALLAAAASAASVGIIVRFEQKPPPREFNEYSERGY
jgi:hypothetical protein